MADNFCIMRMEKIGKIGSVASAVEHELRTRETDNADEKLISKNLYSDKVGRVYKTEFSTKLEDRKKIQNRIIGNYKKLLPEKMKEDNVTCIQVMVTYSPKAKVDPIKYFKDAEDWVAKKFGAENVFFTSRHFDETTPHANFFVVPGYDFKYKDGHTERRLSAKKWLGGRKKMSELQDSFYENVGKAHHLERGEKGSKAKHQDIQKWYKKFNEFCEELHIEPQKENETVDQYFKRVAANWNFFTDNFNKFQKQIGTLKHEHDFYKQYHDNLPALKKYVEELEKKALKRSQNRSDEGYRGR